MRSFPPLPNVLGPDAPDDLLSGHLWLLELIDGTGLRVRMDESGLLRFGDPETIYESFDAVPLALRPAVRHVRERFDREALRASVDDPAGVVFFGVAPHYRGTEYDWERLPPFLGTDVWSDEAATAGGAFRPPDAAAAIFEGVGLDPITVVERERNARDFDPEAYRIPESAWRDGPAAGVVVRNKRGGRGRITPDHADASEDASAPASDPIDRSASDELDALDEIVARYVTRARVDRAVDSAGRGGDPPAIGPIADRVVESVARETPVGFGGEAAFAVAVDRDEFRTAAMDRVRRVVRTSGT
ncbi:hypothetical protein C461_05062 [Halorubrum aidingense JCM 13560]|uniref:RNA ligase domain-containing protein n=1 Tax=Halorubrum aidingense JCM 13560 TaxID=1230454 RepID=M0PGF3_9EURY|nr:hypothetical protein [Halorubrum aidingense]EMA68973.1 hypothetical protein C461_05062 [Halorubrum aidingense JCM 13560]